MLDSTIKIRAQVLAKAINSTPFYDVLRHVVISPNLKSSSVFRVICDK